jgi:hypothetical protein
VLTLCTLFCNRIWQTRFKKMQKKYVRSDNKVFSVVISNPSHNAGRKELTDAYKLINTGGHSILKG